MSAPILPSIFESLAQIFHAFLRLVITSGQSSYVAVMGGPRYLNDNTVSSGLPYTCNAVDATTCDSFFWQSPPCLVYASVT